MTRPVRIASPPETSHLIFVLAGDRQRKLYALDLFRLGYAPQLLLSVGRFEIRRLPELPLPHPLDLLSVAQPIPPPERHFLVAFTAAKVTFEKIPVGKFGTLTEIQALARWCHQYPESTELMVVSSAGHLRRVRLCCRALLSASVRVHYVATPDPAAGPSHPRLRTRILELLKLAAYVPIVTWLRLTAGRATTQSHDT